MLVLDTKSRLVTVNEVWVACFKLVIGGLIPLLFITFEKINLI